MYAPLCIPCSYMISGQQQTQHKKLPVRTTPIFQQSTFTWLNWRTVCCCCNQICLLPQRFEETTRKRRALVSPARTPNHCVSLGREGRGPGGDGGRLKNRPSLMRVIRQSVAHMDGLFESTHALRTNFIARFVCTTTVLSISSAAGTLLSRAELLERTVSYYSYYYYYDSDAYYNRCHRYRTAVQQRARARLLPSRISKKQNSDETWQSFSTTRIRTRGQQRRNPCKAKQNKKDGEYRCEGLRERWG